jgi:hypothetical protein
MGEQSTLPRQASEYELLKVRRSSRTSGRGLEHR